MQGRIFKQHPELALGRSQFDPVKHRDYYRFNYEKAFEDIAVGKIDSEGELSFYRTAILRDLWFIIYFVMQVPDEINPNSPFVVGSCREVQDGPITNTLDIWARFHYKALPHSQPIPTPDGFKKHGDLRPGDKVFNRQGDPVNVKAETRTFNNAPSYNIMFDDGTSIISTENHLWFIGYTSRQRISGTNLRIGKIEEVWETKAIYDYYELRKKINSRSPIFIRNADAYKCNEKELPIPPYTLGAWLGDGTSKSASITCSYDDISIIKNIKNEGVRVIERKSGNANSGLFTLNCGIRGKKGTGMTAVLRKIGAWNNKHIPENYFFASENQRLELLRGLMDTDGSISKHDNVATFVNINKRLCEDVKRLAESLGYKSFLKTYHHKNNFSDNYLSYRTVFTCHSSLPSPFRLNRKSARITKTSERRCRYITSIEPIKSVPSKCIQVEGDGSYLVGPQCIPTHNSTIITKAESAQFHMKFPDKCSCIFSYKKPLAEDFLDSIRKIYESPIMLKCFPDLLYEKPYTQSPSWSTQNGIIIKRQLQTRTEATIEASGLVEGMVTGKHFDRKVFDDCETFDMAQSADELLKCISAIEMAINNLGTGSDEDINRFIGTFYSHAGPMVHLKEKKDVDGDLKYITRIKPVTEDGTPNGKPVLVSEKKHEDLKASMHYRSQQLCDPTPRGFQALKSECLIDIEPELIPRNLHKFLIIDPAGDKKTQKTGKDSWAFEVIGVEPVADSEIGAYNKYLLDAVIAQMSESEAIDTAVKMYMRGGMIEKIGIEKVGLSSVETHVKNALSVKGRRVSVEDGTIVILQPAGRSKAQRIEKSLSWPLNNGKWFISKSISSVYRDRIRMEMDKFPYWHDDGLDPMAYLDDIIKDFHFEMRTTDPAQRDADRKRHDNYDPLYGQDNSSQDRKRASEYSPI